jgi:hypothetical protein
MDIGTLWVFYNSLWRIEAFNGKTVVLENLFTYNLIELPLEIFTKEAVSTGG